MRPPALTVTPAAFDFGRVARLPAANGIDPGAAAGVDAAPAPAPVARLEKTDHPLVIETGDLLLDLSTPNEGLEIVIQGLVGALPGLIAQQTFAFGTDALPVPVTLENARLEPDNLAPSLHLRADIGRRAGSRPSDGRNRDRPFRQESSRIGMPPGEDSMLKLICPVSGERIDRNVVRTNGLLTTTGLLAYVFTGSPLLIVPIGLDCVLRTSMTAPTSPMTHRPVRSPHWSRSSISAWAVSCTPISRCPSSGPARRRRRRRAPRWQARRRPTRPPLRRRAPAETVRPLGFCCAREGTAPRWWFSPLQTRSPGP